MIGFLVSQQITHAYSTFFVHFVLAHLLLEHFFSFDAFGCRFEQVVDPLNGKIRTRLPQSTHTSAPCKI